MQQELFVTLVHEAELRVEKRQAKQFGVHIVETET
jgi:hypothetical protein